MLFLQWRPLALSYLPCSLDAVAVLNLLHLCFSLALYVLLVVRLIYKRAHVPARAPVVKHTAGTGQNYSASDLRME